jgi:DNA invertase Pin-like site-specific DNA recombinase
LADFGKPTGEFGTVEQTNEDDALVKWDDDGQMRLHQPWGEYIDVGESGAKDSRPKLNELMADARKR